MKFGDLYALMEERAPKELSDKLREKDGLYDNSGIIAPTDADIKKVLFCLDLTVKSARFAAENGCGAIITHHPAIYKPIKNLKSEDPLFFCVKNGIGVISAHLNLDCAERGTDYYLAAGLGGEIADIYENFGDGTGYGRLVLTGGKTAREISENYKKVFGTDKAYLYGDPERKINSLVSLCGAGADDGAIEYALGKRADMIVSADISHHVLLPALESGLCVLSCTHYGTENYGMKKFAEDFARDYETYIKTIYFDDERFA